MKPPRFAPGLLLFGSLRCAVVTDHPDRVGKTNTIDNAPTIQTHFGKPGVGGGGPPVQSGNDSARITRSFQTTCTGEFPGLIFNITCSTTPGQTSYWNTLRNRHLEHAIAQINGQVPALFQIPKKRWSFSVLVKV